MDHKCILKKSDKGELAPIFICFARTHEYTAPILSKEISWNLFIAADSKVCHFNQCITNLQFLKYFEFEKQCISTEISYILLSKMRFFCNFYQWYGQGTFRGERFKNKQWNQ